MATWLRIVFVVAAVCLAICQSLPKYRTHFNAKWQAATKELFNNGNIYDKHTFSVDPESYMNISQLITSKEYPCEEYTVRTPDGFLLDIQRIPHGRHNSTRHNSTRHTATQRPVTFLQHGLLCSSATWVINPANESLAFILADAGFDVWLGNVRGNTYGRHHVSLKPDQDAFWAWSMDEMAKYDLPSMVDFVLNRTNQSQLYYMGHSQGTFIGFVKFSQDPEFAKKIKLFIALAPIFDVGYAITPIRLFEFAEDKYLFDLFGQQDFLPNAYSVKLMARTVCNVKYLRSVCASVIFALCGIDVQNFNMSRLPVILSHTPAGTSTRNMIHWLQMVRSHNAQMYDFESATENMKHYGQPKPPVYNVSKMTTPVAIMSGDHDWLADPKDVALLKTKLRSLVSDTFVAGYNHLDFVWATNAPSKIYKKIISLVHKFS